ncbi:MAG: SAM-dependent methyltransferase [Roseburia sp.]|nr:SAM-dependent methyltransferase [Roseburia sp.]
MDELRSLLQQMLNEELIQIILSNSRNTEEAAKVKVRPVLIKGRLFFQETLYRGNQVFHENLTKADAAVRIEEYLQRLFRQGELKATSREATVLVGKKGKMTIKSRKRIPTVREGEAAPSIEGGNDARAASLEHNRRKRYILQDGMVVDFLVGLGVQSADGRINKARYDKFRQINRYLEFIEDVLEELPTDRQIRIIDFGCGKSYLTFAMYYYLHVLWGRDILVTGLDLKTEVIADCNRLAESLGYENLHFEQGDISAYQGADSVDMVVSLHACDTATDYALEKAVKWGARVILAVPCCQHELNRQIDNPLLKPLLKYGLLKERMAALVTDAVRAGLLEQQGYDTQILEFIDMEHTPKNLLIRAVKSRAVCPAARLEKIQTGLEELESFLQISPTLERLLKNKAEES